MSELTAKRFERPIERRDFLGIGATTAACTAAALATGGAMRLPMPSVFPESNPRFKAGVPDQYAVDSVTYLADRRVYIFRDAEGLYAISAVCTHLGCLVHHREDGGFACPCHGSRFDATGRVEGGPAPRALEWLDVSLAPTGALVIDASKQVPAGTKFAV